jgi:hypothetical protein
VVVSSGEDGLAREHLGKDAADGPDVDCLGNESKEQGAISARWSRHEITRAARVPFIMDGSLNVLWCIA